LLAQWHRGNSRFDSAMQSSTEKLRLRRNGNGPLQKRAVLRL